MLKNSTKRYKTLQNSTLKIKNIIQKTKVDKKILKKVLEKHANLLKKATFISFIFVVTTIKY